MTPKNPNAVFVDIMINTLPENQLHDVNGNEHHSPTHSQNRTDLWNEISNAVCEKDILALRQKLQGISINANHVKSDQESVFELTEMLDIQGFLDQCPVSSPDLMSFTEPLPKIHIHNHRRAAGETVHQLYREQNNSISDYTDSEEISEATKEWELIGESIMEKDIMDLRESLKHISSLNSRQVYSTGDIEMYLEGQMTDEEKSDFKDELLVNPELRADIKLNMELKEAVSEKDIMALRSSLEDIIKKQNSTSKSLIEIEAYLDGELPDSERTSFMEELTDNDDLKAEVRLLKELNSTFSEKDILKLRDNLKKISTEIDQQEKKSFLPSHNFKKNIRRAGTVAAIFIFLTGLSFFFNYSGESENEVFIKYFKTPQSISTFRSIEKNANLDLEKAFAFYDQSDYQTAQAYFRKVMEKDATLWVAHFYSGACYQGLKSYEKAILEYNNVIQNNNNIFVAQAEWYRALCNFGLGNRKTAISQLEAINNKNGDFGKDAKSLLKQMKLK